MCKKIKSWLKYYRYIFEPIVDNRQLKFHSSDYFDALEVGMEPQKGSQYWVCQVIVV